MVLPGKDVTTQAEAEDTALGKVRLVTEADVAFNEGVIEVNLAFAREYSALARQQSTAVRGANRDPGNTAFNPTSDLPSFGGVEQAQPNFRNRIIGDVNLLDSYLRASAVMGKRISLRARVRLCTAGFGCKVPQSWKPPSGTRSYWGSSPWGSAPPWAMVPRSGGAAPWWAVTYPPVR